MTNVRKDLPPELTKELVSVRTGDDYTLRDLALAYIAHHGAATLDDIMIYFYVIRGKITSRGYMYQMVHRLRSEGLLKQAEKATPHNVVYRLTEEGEEAAPEYLIPKKEKVT